MGGVNNPNPSRPQPYIVIDDSGDGDYTDIATAISSEPIGTSFLLVGNGTDYPVTVAVNIKNGQSIKGVNFPTIAMSGGELLLEGINADSLGTLAAGTSGTNVNGSGTSFTTGLTEWIMINYALYNVASVASITNLTIDFPIEGNTSFFPGQFFDAWQEFHENSSFEDLRILSNSSTLFGWQMRLENCRNTTFKNVIFDGDQNLEAGCLRLVHCVNVVIDNCKFTQNSSGIVFANERSYNTVISNSEIESNMFGGITVAFGFGVTLKDCLVNNNGFYGLRLTNDSRKLKVIGGQFNNNAGSGIDFLHTSMFDVDSELTNLTISSSIGAGVFIRSIEHVSINGGNYSNCGGSAVQITAGGSGTADRISVRDLNARNNTGWGINCTQTGARKMLFNDNQFDGNVAGAINDTTTGSVTADNQI